MPYRVSFKNVQQADLLGGYSENFWNSATSDTSVLDRATALATALFNVKGYGANIPAARVSAVDLFRQVFIIQLGLASSPNTGLYNADALTTKLLMEFRTDNPKILTRQWLGSIPDNSVDAAGRYKPTSNFLSNFGALRGILAGGNGWCLSKQDTTIPKINVSAVTQAGVVTTVVDHGVVTGERVRLSRVKDPTGVNGVYRVLKLLNNTLQLVGFTDPDQPILVRDSTYIQKQARVLTDIKDVRVVRCSSHKVGRPFGLASGRARTR